MPVTKEQVEAKAKELGLTVTPDNVAMFVTMGVLPAKADPASPAGDDKGEGEGDVEGEDTLTAGMKKRLAKEKEKRVAMQKDLDEKVAKLKALEEAGADKARTDSEKKGEYDKLLAETKADKEKLNASLKTVQEKFKQNTIEREIGDALLEAGVPKDRLPKAIKMFLLEKSGDVKFEWSDVEKFEADIDGVTEAVEGFKKENDFLFGNSMDENQNQNKNGFNPVPRQPQKRVDTKTDKAKDDFKKKYPRVFGY